MRGADPDVVSVSDFRNILSYCFEGDVVIPQLSSEVKDALYCLSKVCLGSTPDESVVRDSSRTLPVELIYSLHLLVSFFHVLFIYDHFLLCLLILIATFIL